MTKPLLHILVFLSCCFSGEAQELLFSNISNEMQLPSQECYNILQDKKGYIWFGTDNGLCRFNNNHLTVFDARNGLPEKSVYVMEEDKTGKIWLATSDNRILFLDESSQLKEAAFSKAYQKTAPAWAHATPYILDVSDPDKIYISTYYYAACADSKTNKVIRIKEPQSKSYLTFTKKTGHPFFRLVYEALPHKSTFELISGNLNEQIAFSEFGEDFFAHPRTLTHLSGTTDFIGLHDRLLKINPDLSYSVYKFPERILSLYTDKSGGLWVGTFNNGVFYYPDITTMQLGHHSLKNYSVTGICEDKEQGIWCSTLEKGIFYSKNKHLISYSSIAGLDRSLTLLEFYNQSVYASSSAKDIFRFMHDTMEQFPVLDEKKGTFSDICQKGNSWFLIGKEIIVQTKNRFHNPNRLFQKHYGAIGSYELAHSNHGRLISVMYASIFELFEKKQPRLIVSKLPFINKSILAKNRDTFFVGGDQGIYVFNIQNLSYRKLRGIPGHVIKMLRSRSGRIWVITKENGIFWIDGNRVIPADKYLSFKPSVFFDLAEAPDGRIFAGSNRGIFCFKRTGKSYQTTLFTTAHGLPSNEVYKVAADDEKIWFSTFEGLFNLPLSHSSFNKTGPEIHLQHLSVKNNPVTASSQILRFPYNQNDFRFTFDILTFKNGTDTELEYHLKHDGQSTVTKLNGNEVFLENLEPGNYQLIVYGINNDGVRSPRPEVFLITIEAPFWQTGWFISLASFLVLLGIFLVVRVIVRGIRKKEEAKTLVNKLMAEYQISALQAQMNPHFIFNAINTIQGYILEKSEEEAYNYLAKFGKLIRAVLHHSQEKVLLLEHELEVLNLYVELEQLRFDQCFDYELTLSERVFPEDLYLPGMILQPYVENAIWHGIVNLRGSRRGKLQIHMDCENNVLVVTIKDNGIGRKMAMSFNKDRRHKSVGMQLTGERIQVMNQLHGYETASVTITDLPDENGAAAGTRVEVRIPINTEV